MDLRHLNPAQRQAVTHEGGPLLILAGAGTGKTRALIHRVAWLIERGSAPGQILAMTFTHKAADEMRARLEGLIGAAMAGAVTVSTFHSLGARLLRGWAPRLGRSVGFHVYGEGERRALLRATLTGHGCGVEADQLDAAAALIAALKQGSPTPEAAALALSPEAKLAWPQIVMGYEARLRAFDAFDLEDLIARPLEILRADAAARGALQRRWPLILIDELQDTNAAQLDLLEALAPPGAALTGVGDDDQAIYEWRGADVEGILRFQARWGGAIVRLEENYRSTAPILTLANAFIAHNTRRLGKALRAQAEGPPAWLHAARDERAEARWIAAQIERLHEEEGLCYREIAILTRTRLQAEPLKAALELLCVPYQQDDGGLRLDGARVKDALAYLRALSNPLDGLAARRIILRTVRGVGEKTLARLSAAAEAYGCGLIEAAARTELPPRAARALAGLARLLAEARAAITPPLAPHAWALFEAAGLLVEEDEGLEGLLGWLRAREGLDLEAALEALALNAKVEAGGEGVSLLTIHAAKGLEFQAVFLPGLEQGQLPHARAEGLDALEAERRLFYVALTRAARHLFLSWAWRRRAPSGVDEARQPSPFLAALPAAALRGDVEGRTLISLAARGQSKATFEVGDRARHPKLGEGVILEVEGGAWVTARFGDGPPRRVAPRFLDRA